MADGLALTLALVALMGCLNAIAMPAEFALLPLVAGEGGIARANGRVEFARYAGFILGPALGGLLGGMDPRLPFWVAAGLTLLNAMYGLFVLPESLPADRRRVLDWRRANPVGSLKLLRSHRELFGLATVNFLYYLAHQVLMSVFVLYAGYRYNWDERQVGMTLALVGVCSIVVQAGVIRPTVAWLGERRAMLVGLTCGTLGFIGYGLASAGWMFLTAIPVFALIGLYGPSAQGMMTRHVSPSEYGELQGANSSIMGITGMIGPGVFTLTFASFIGARASWHMPGAPFLLAAIMMIVAIVIAARVTTHEGAEAPARV
jgi:DHA1 family tetracycline resistance protein-like MFS transporter